jgi:hypothetical protein
MNSTMTRDRSRLQRWGAMLAAGFLAAAALIVTAPGAAHAALTEETTIPVGDTPASVAVSPDGATVIDAATNAVTDTIPVGDGPYSAAHSRSPRTATDTS